MSQAGADSPSGQNALERLRALLRDGGGLLATLLGPASGSGAESPVGPAAIAAAGPRAEGRREEYELVVEAIYEGYLLHYGEPRVLLSPEADMGLLAGDRLYAIGLARLIALGDTEAVAELADTITLSALAHGADDPELAGVVWEAGARVVGWGPSEQHDRAKEMVLAGDRGALEAMRTICEETHPPVPAPR